MADLDASKLHVKYLGCATATGPVTQRCYTLTHSDRTGDLFLSIGTVYDHDAISGLYTRLMRDEVLAEFIQEGDCLKLNVHCHVSGGIVVGPAGWRAGIFRYHLRSVLQAFRHGDNIFIQTNPAFGKASVQVYFHARTKRHNKVEDWGLFDSYNILG